MKNHRKILVLAVVGLFCSVNFALAALPTALSEATAITDTSAANISLNLSPNVGIDYTVNATFDAYTLVTANGQGTKAYGIQQDFEGILMTIGDFTDSTAAPTPANWTDADWKVMGDTSDTLPDVLLTETASN